MIETKKGLINLEKILSVKGLDGILIGPYDLSASLGITGNFTNKKFINAIKKILNLAKKYNVAVGIHIINPSITELKLRINEGYTFIAYSIDSVMLLENSLKNQRNKVTIFMSNKLNKPNILALIPARMGSSRFPGKPMAKILGKPMIGHVYEKVSSSNLLNKIVVATCDNEILDYINKNGGEAVMTSNKHERASDRCLKPL